MEEVREAYVSFETVKLLKEKGFNELCEKYYTEQGHFTWVDSRWHAKGSRNSCLSIKTEERFSAPTIQMACQWLRKIKHYYIQVMLDSWALGSHSGYYIVIQATDSDFEEISPWCEQVFFNEPEEAAEAGLKYCLENLVK